MIGIITALPNEYVAMKSMLEEPVEDKIPGKGAGLFYCKGTITSKIRGRHQIVLVLANQGNNTGTFYATTLLNKFPGIENIIMVGIAGGVPKPNKIDEHVRLGDVVISSEQGVVQYDFNKEEYDFDSERPVVTPRHYPRAPGAMLLEAVRLLKSREFEGKKEWIDHLNVRERLNGFEVPQISSDILHDYEGKEITHPKDNTRIEGIPKVFFGTIGSANKLLKNPVLRDYLGDHFKVKAIEMEGSGIADASWFGERGYLVIRGICDYCDPYKGDNWQNHAALVAAAFTKGLIESIPSEEQFESATNVLDNSKKVESIMPRAIEHNRFLTGKLAGRETIIKSIVEDRILTGSTRWIALTGEPGVGKSALAAHIAEGIKNKFSNVNVSIFWTNLQLEIPSTAALRWLTHFNLNFDSADEITRISQLEKMLSDYPSVLVLDNAKSTEDLKKLFLKIPNVFIITTSRNKSIVPSEFDENSVETLSTQESLTLLESLTSKARIEAEPEAAQGICDLCGGFPLAIHIVASQLKNTIRWKNLVDFEKKLANSTIDTLSSGTNENVRRAFDVSYNNLKEDEKAVFESLSIFKGNITSAEVSFIHGIDAKNLLNNLSDLYLIREYGNDNYGMHDLLHLYADEKGKLNVENMKAWKIKLFKYYASFTEEKAKQYLDLDKLWPTLHPLLKEFASTSETSEDYVAITKNIHSYLKDRGLWDMLYEFGRNSFELTQVPEDKAYIASWILSWVLFQQGKFTDGEDLARQGLALYDKAGDVKGKAVAKRRIGMALIEQKQYEDARQFLNEAIQSFGESGMELKKADTLNVLGFLERKLGNYTKANELFEQVRAIVEGKDNKETAMVLYSLARLKATEGKLRDAISFHEQSMELDKQESRKPGIAYNTYRIAQLHLLLNDPPKEQWLGNLGKAEEMFLQLGNIKRIKDISEFRNRNNL